MGNEARTTSGWQPPELAPDVEPLYRAFEAAWQAGQRPAIEEYLQEVPSTARASLLRALVRLELIYRGRHRPRPTPEEYRARFPQEADLIVAVFRDTPTASDAPPGPAPTSSVPTAVAREPIADLPAVPGYEILEPLTPGGMGVVYRARQIALNRTVALKMIRTGVHAGAHERARFRIEAEAVASLSHPHIIPIYDFGEWNGMPYLAMEFAAGGSLAQRLADRPLPPAEAAALLEILARAARFVHERGLIHRDLKPANVLLTEQGVPKLADFGLAKRLDQDQGLTHTQAVLGTASYMAPEQATGDKEALGPAADVYALGAILYEILTGRPPFLAATHELTIHQVLSQEPLPPSRLRPEVPAELEAICLKCLEKDPADRFDSALALAEDLRRYQEGEPISAQALGSFDWHTRWARRAGYEILDLLGVAAGGFLYKARHLPLKRIVALQIISAPGRLEPAQLAGLRVRAEAAAQLRHPHIAEVYDFGEHQGQTYITTEYVPGPSLAESLHGPARSAEQTAALIEMLARALHQAHQHGLIHGRLKPSRVLLGAEGTCKITGLELADLDAGAPGPRRGFPGLSRYLAPEQVEGGADVLGPATDVHALGAILYELLSGRPPVMAETVEDLLQELRRGKPEPPRHWRPEIPANLEAICLKCLQKDPAQRYPSAAALAEDLRRFRGGEVLFIDDLDDPVQLERWARRAGYEIIEILGRSPAGFSCKARQIAHDRVVVLKRITARDRFVPAAKSRFRRQIHLLAGLRHPNIVQLHEHGEHNDLTYFAREFVDGPSLAEQVAEGPLRAAVAAEMVETLARTLQMVHAHGLVHGGLNPGDIRLTPAGVPKITSFRRHSLPGSDTDAAQPVREIRRRTGYLAPEQLDRRNWRLHPATDIYALGAILYTLLAAQPPVVGPTLAEALEQVRSGPPLPPSRWQPDIPSDLEALCLACLQKQPDRRPASAQILAEQLRQFVTV